MIIAETKTGPIELVYKDGIGLLQFNCECTSALPWCNAICCRQRPVFNVELTEAEKGAFQGVNHPKKPGVQLVAYNANHECVYLQGDKCSIHHEKPSGCANWHCSPRGKGEGITRRGQGWLLIPAGATTK